MRTGGVPFEAVSIYNNALAYSCRGDYTSALIEYTKAIELFPSFIEAYNNMGEIYSRTGQRNLALSTYNRALGIDRHYKVLLNLGVEYFNERDYKTALRFFTESLSKEPEYLEGNYYLGLAHFNLKNYNAAEKCLSKVVRIDRRHVKANYLLSYIYYERKDYRRVLQCLDCIRDIADDKRFVNRYYGFCYYNLGNFREAVGYLKIALEESPQYARFQGYLAGLTYENKLKEIGDLEMRIREMEQKLMSETPTVSTLSHLSMLYVFKGEYKKAENLLLSSRINK
jgi:tetratricopeptide (TPR) repeat protein